MTTTKKTAAAAPVSKGNCERETERKDEQRGEIIKTLTERVTGNRRRQQRQKDSFTTTTTTTKFHPKSADRRQLISAYPVAIR